MCRILAVRSQVELPLYRILLTGDNSFAVQSLEHPDGWGLAYYSEGQPTLVRSMRPAICDDLFEKISFEVHSRTVLGHIRRATAGVVSEANCHPFSYGVWSFVHNGHIHGFEAIKERLLEHVAPNLRGQIQGSTDSEVYFHLFLSQLQKRGLMDQPKPEYDGVRAALAQTVATIHEIANNRPNRTDDLPCWLSCIATTGPLMLGLSGGKHLSVRRVEDNPEAPYVMFSSEAIAAKGFASTGGSWLELADDEIAFIGEDLVLERRPLS